MAEVRGTHYDVLGVPSTASPALVHDAYVELARRHHPDVAGGDANRMQAINAAWRTLGDPARRALYDQSLAALAGDPPEQGATVSRPWLWDVDEEAERLAEMHDLRSDLEDDRPIGGTIVLPRWMSVLPVATFGLSVVCFCLGVLMAQPGLVGLAIVEFLISCLMFIAAPFMALLASRRRWR